MKILSMDRFGRTLLLVLFLLMMLKGLSMAIRLTVPYAEKVDQSFGDFLTAISD